MLSTSENDPGGQNSAAAAGSAKETSRSLIAEKLRRCFRQSSPTQELLQCYIYSGYIILKVAYDIMRKLSKLPA